MEARILNPDKQKEWGDMVVIADSRFAEYLEPHFIAAGVSCTYSAWAKDAFRLTPSPTLTVVINPIAADIAAIKSHVCPNVQRPPDSGLFEQEVWTFGDRWVLCINLPSGPEGLPLPGDSVKMFRAIQRVWERSIGSRCLTILHPDESCVEVIGEDVFPEHLVTLCDKFLDGALTVAQVLGELPRHRVDLSHSYLVHQFDYHYEGGHLFNKPVITYDIEASVDVRGKNLDRLTARHPKSELLCLSISAMFLEKGSSLNESKNVIVRSIVFPVVTRELVVHILDSAGLLAGHHSKFDLTGLASFLGIDLSLYRNWLPHWCTMGMVYVPNQNPPLAYQGGTGLGLKPLCKQRFGAGEWDAKLEEMRPAIEAKIKQMMAEYKAGERAFPPEPFHYGYFPLLDLMLYCGLDTAWTMVLLVDAYSDICAVALQDIKKDSPYPDLLSYFGFLYMPTVNCLAEVEMNGIYMDKDELRDIARDYTLHADQLRNEIAVCPEIKEAEAISGSDFNTRSSKFLSALVETTGCQALSEQTKTGAWSCNKHILAKLRDEDVPFERKSYIARLWDYIYHIRRYENVVSKNIKSTLPYLVNGKVHPTFITATSGGKGTKTGRATTVNPSTNTWLKEPRFLAAMKAPPGRICAKGDWKSIEPMVHALCAGCEEWLDIFRNYRRDPHNKRSDIYRMIYGPVIGVEPEDVTKEQRDQAKVFLLAMLYDRHPTTVARELGMSVADAYSLCSNFWTLYPGIAERSNRIKLQFLRGEYLRNPFGQRIFYPNRADGGAYPDDILSYIREQYMSRPLYEWAEDRLIAQYIHRDDLDDCRKVGNWEIQSSGWTITKSMLPGLMDTLEPYGDSVHETIHDAYRMYPQLKLVREQVNAMMKFFSSLENGNLRHVAEKVCQVLGVTSLDRIPACIDFAFGPDFGSLEEWVPGDPLPC